MKTWFLGLLDFIYKQKCVVCSCSKTNEILCKTCAKDVNYLAPFAQRIIDGVNIYSAFKYDGVVSKIIKNFKFNKRKSAYIPFSRLLFDYINNVVLANNINIDKNCVLVYVPSHPLRLINRGYNHLELVTKELSLLLNIPFDNSLIKKVKNTRPQYKMRVNQKKKNVENSFLITENNTSKRIILIDDTITSGSTVGEVIKKLNEKGFNDILCFTLACS